MISLRPIFSGDPFCAYPALQTIWPQPLVARAQYDTVESLVDIDDDDFGAIFLIVEADLVIGITGYYRYNDSGTELGLRWHGLLPSHRGKGLSKTVIDALLAWIHPREPLASTLIELIPDIDYGIALRRHFEQLGFRSVGPLEHYDWSDHAWQPYHLTVEQQTVVASL